MPLTDKIFGEILLALFPLSEWLPDAILFKITKENAVAETAFFVDKGAKIQLRWFTPEIEMGFVWSCNTRNSSLFKNNLKLPKR